MKYRIGLTYITLDEKDLPAFIKENLQHECISYEGDEQSYLSIIQHIFNNYVQEMLPYIDTSEIDVTYFVKRPPIFRLSWKNPLEVENTTNSSKPIKESYFTGQFVDLLEDEYLGLYDDDEEQQNANFIKMLLDNEMIYEEVKPTRLHI